MLTIEQIYHANRAVTLYRQCGRFAALRYVQRRGVPLRAYADALLIHVGLARWHI